MPTGAATTGCEYKFNAQVDAPDALKDNMKNCWLDILTG
jgi:hypothetical protein